MKNYLIANNGRQFATSLIVGALFFCSAPVKAGTLSVWGPAARTPSVNIQQNNYISDSDDLRQCHDQDFILQAANDEAGKPIFQDTTYTQCAFYTAYGLVSNGNILYFNNTPQPYHLAVTSFFKNIITTPNAHSLYVQDGPLFEAYDNPADAFIVGEGTDSWAAHTIYKQEYYLKDGVTPRLLKDSNGQTIQYIKHTKISQDGNWLILEKGTQLLRVRADDFTDLLTFPGDPLFHGQDPNDDMTISNDGRYVVLTANNHLSFRMYDLSTCAPNPTYNLTNATGCGSLDMVPTLTAGLGEPVSHVDEPQFSPDGGRLTVRVSAGSGDSAHTELVELAAAGASDGNTMSRPTNYLALGDSYASGEGEFNYYSGTDEATNKCHLSGQSYPFLLGLRFQLDSFHSVACSGAKMINVNGAPLSAAQHGVRPLDGYSDYWLPGYNPQLQYIQQNQPNIVTISMGGNDVGFSDIIKRCVVLGTCYPSYEERVGLVLNINSKFDSLVNMYAEMKSATAADTRIYVIGYPTIVKPDGDCGANVHMNRAETEFASELENYLNSVIELAAMKAGVTYVDTSDAFDGNRLCEDSEVKAVNGLTSGNDSLGVLGQESYHPTVFGHQLLANDIANFTESLTKPNAAPNWGIAAPELSDATSFTNAPETGQQVRQIEIDDETPVIQTDSSIAGSLPYGRYFLAPDTSYEVWIHSTPVKLGSVRTDVDGNLRYDLAIPSGLEPGWHSVDVYGEDIRGQAVDIQRLIYVPASANDWDGDGVPNSQEPCGLIDPAGKDVEGDGIDDACDLIIGAAANPTEQPPSQSPGSQSGSSSSQNGGGYDTATIQTASSSSELSDKQDIGVLTTTEDVASGPGAVLGIQAPASNKATPRQLNRGTNHYNNYKSQLAILTIVIVSMFWLVRHRRRV